MDMLELLSAEEIKKEDEDMWETDASMRARLVESLSSSFPGSALSRALQAMDDEDLDKDPLSRSCFAELRLEKGRMEEDFEEEDDDLTSLEWLQDTDLLKNISTGTHSLCTSPTDDMQKENAIGGTVYGQSHPPHVPYNPQKHVNSKPPYSFSCLIFMAIEDNPHKKLPVKDIYNWILTHFPYFRNAPTGWKNSVRHNLSLNKCFKKVEKEKGHGLGKGSLWCIDPIFRPNLLQALRKTPYHPYHQLQMLSSPQPPAGLYTIHGLTPPGVGRPLPLAPKLNINTPSPHLFPFLSKRLSLSQSGVLQDSVPLADSDIDVANTLVSLKRAAESRRPLKSHNGQRSRSPSPPEFGSAREKELLRRKSWASRPKVPEVCTAAPSSDHAYCLSQEQVDSITAALSPSSSIDEEYDFGIDDDDQEDGVTDKRKADFSQKTSDFDRSHSDIECTESEGSDSGGDNDGGSDGEQRSRVRGLVVKLNTHKRKRKSTSPVPLYKKRVVDTDEDDEDEAKKIVEGADALLNLASAAMSLRSHSPSHNNNNNTASSTNNNNYDKSAAHSTRSRTVAAQSQ